MAQAIEFDRVPVSKPLFAGFDSSAIEDAESDASDFYQEIAERRAALECAETLRRVRAL